MGDIYVVTESFSATLDGHPHMFRKGDTVREGHEVFRNYRGSLKEIKPTYEYEAPKPPPAPRPAPVVAPAKKAAPAPLKVATPPAPAPPKKVTDGV